jgi:type III pantothenate kinase
MLLSLGTACVIDYFNPAGIHEGGIITAGAHLRVWALSQRTGQLPLVEPEIPSKLWGTDTPDALRAGAIHGLGLEIQGWIRSLMGNKAGLLWVSGGEAPLVKPYLPSNAIFAPDLTLRGAWLWWHYLQQGRFPS